MSVVVGARPPLIELRNLTKTYRSGVLETVVLRGIDIRIEAGEFVAIVGPSGSGKSTLMHLLGALERPAEGAYFFNGEDVAALDADALAALRRDAFGFVFQSYHLLAQTTALENVALPAIYKAIPRAERLRRGQYLLERLGLGERIHFYPNQLSGGQQQRVSIARALMNGGRVILADEPTGALDSKTGNEVMALLHELAAEGHTVILITHDRTVASRARRIIELSDGRVVSDSGAVTPAEVSAATLRCQADLLAQRASGLGMHELLESCRTAMRALSANLFRTALTLLGIVIGVAAVIAMLAIGDGARAQVLSQINSMGSNLLTVRGGAPNQRGRSASLTPEDVQVLLQVDNVQVAIPEQTTNVTARYGGRDILTTLNGTGAQFPLVRSWPLERGRFFSRADEERYAAVAVLGKTVADALFPRGDALGQFILVKNIPFLIVGTLTAKGASSWGSDQDDVIFAPFGTASLRVNGERNLRNIVVALHDSGRIEETQSTIHSVLLRQHRGVEDFSIRNMAAIIEAADETAAAFGVLLTAVAAISLLVGGIGVMNIMLVSVTERTREIGIRMATGAHSRHIQQQFLVEAIVVCTIGGLAGVALGVALSMTGYYFGLSVRLAWLPILLAFGCAFMIGLIFGYFPARKASRLDPVVALVSD